MFRPLIFCILFLSANCLRSQIAGSFTIPGSFPSVAAAVNTLNVLGVAGNVTINVTAGHTETVQTGGINMMPTAGASSTSQIIFRKFGTGANPELIAYSGGTATAGSAVRDGIWMLVDANFVTIDGISFTDPNTSSPNTMEYGLGCFKASNSAGCMYNTVKNCVFSGKLGNGILFEQVAYNYQSSAITITNTAAANSYNKFYNNLIQNAGYGIRITGSIYTIYGNDGNDIGGNSSLTSNTITGCGYGIHLSNEKNLNASYNVITSNTIVAATCGIYVVGSSSLSIAHNTITMQMVQGINSIYGIRHLGSQSTASITSNFFPSYSYSNTTGVNGTTKLIAVEGGSLLVISNNTIQSMTQNSGTLTAISAVDVWTVNIVGNKVSGMDITTRGVVQGIAGSSDEMYISGNTINNLTAYSTNSNVVRGIFGEGRIFKMSVNSNTISNLKGQDVYGASLSATVSAPSFTVSGNAIQSFSAAPGTTIGCAGAGIFTGVSSTGGTVTVLSNTISDLRGVGYSNTQNYNGLISALNVQSYRTIVGHNKIYDLISTGANGVRGIILQSSSADIYNNIVGNLYATASPVLMAFYAPSSSGNFSFNHNTFYLNNSSSTASNFSPIVVEYLGFTAAVFKNNIMVNTSSTTGSGEAAIYRVNSFSSSSNNNIYYLGATSPQRLVRWSTPSSSTIAGYKAIASPGETQSLFENVAFATTAGTASGFLNIDPLIPTQAESGGVSVPSVTVDIVNTVRSSTPDVGAWEGAYTKADATPPVLLDQGFTSSPCNLSGRTLTVSLKDTSAIAGGSLSPRVYSKVNFGLYTSTPGTLTAGTATNGVWTFSIPYSASPSDIIHYFFAVQDQSPLNNHTLFPASTNGSMDNVNTVNVPPSPAYTFQVISPPTISVSSGSICSGNSFTLSPSGAATYTFSSGSAIVSPNVTSSYSISGTNSVGCISASSAVATVSVFYPPTVTVSSGTVCSGYTFTISPSGASTYSYSGGLQTVMPNTTTSYSVTGYSAEGCASQQETLTVQVFASPTVAASSGSVCVGSSFVINASGADIPQISGGLFTVTPANTNTYSVWGINNNGCVSLNTVQVVVTVYSLPTIAVNGGTICQGNSFVLSPTGASSYSFSSGSATVTPVQNASYTITGASAQGCEAASPAVVNVTVYPTPVVSVNSGTICRGDQFTITPAGASIYTIQGGTSVVAPVSLSIYSVVGSNTSGCISAPVFATITVNALPTVAVQGGTICQGSSFVISPTGAQTYSINGGTFTVSPTVSSTFSIWGITDGCSSDNPTSVAIVVNPLPQTGIVTTDTVVCEGTDIILTATGAVTYSWSDGSNTSVIQVTINQSTVYVVTGLDANNCERTASISVSAENCVSISEVNKSGPIKFYPNPVSEELVVTNAEGANLFVYNNLGQLVMQTKLSSGSEKINVSHLPSGIYSVRLNGSLQAMKIIKQ